MDRPYVAENDAERQRLKAFVARVSDAEMVRRVGQHWTVGIALAHIAFWDQHWLARFEEWERNGVVDTAWLARAAEWDRSGADFDGNFQKVNDAMLPWWSTMTPTRVRQDVIAAAEAIDHFLERLPEPLVQAVLSVRPRTLTRAIHRREILNEIEATLAR